MDPGRAMDKSTAQHRRQQPLQQQQHQNHRNAKMTLSSSTTTLLIALVLSSDPSLTSRRIFSEAWSASKTTKFFQNKHSGRGVEVASWSHASILPSLNGELYNNARRSKGHYITTTTYRHVNPLPWEVDDGDSDSNLKTRVSERSSKMGKQSMQTSQLAKLAAAFSPPDQAIDPGMIDNVEVINVEGDRIEISVTLCDGEALGTGCVALFVPVTFPNSCLHLFYNEEEEMCILENLDRLHHQAEGRITKQESVRTSDALEFGRSDLQLDQSRPSNIRAMAPSWWVAAEDVFGPELIPSLKTTELVEECASVKQILNCGEFDDELKVLAHDGMASGVKDGLSMDVEKAVVADVSPSGFFMRARTINPQNQRSIVELFWPFDGAEPCKDARTLRSKVLGAVAAVSL